MRTLLLASFMVLIAFPAAAISRYQSMSLSCHRVQAIIRHEGAAIIYYPSKFSSRRMLFDRYVADDRFCDSLRYPQLTTIPTADNPRCQVLYCKQRSGGYDHGEKMK